MFKPGLLTNAIVFAILPSILMTVGICIYTIQITSEKQEILIQTQVASLLDAVGYVSETELSQKSSASTTLPQRLRNIHASSSLPVFRIQVYDRNNVIFASSKVDSVASKAQQQHLIDFQKSIYLNTSDNQQTQIGHVIITLDKSSEVYERFMTNLGLTVMICIAVLLTGLIMLGLIKKLLTPLHEFVEAVKRIGSGDFKYRLEIEAEYEMNELKDGINRMAKQLYDNQAKLESEIEDATSDLQQNLLLVEEKNAELDIARKEALEASKIKSEFLATMSHEVRTPLNAIVGFTNELKKAKLAPPYADYVAIMHSSTDNLMSIVNDILDFSKIEAGKMELDQSTFKLVETIEDVVKLMARDAFAKKLVFSFEADNLPTTAIGDERRFKQILTNLLSNAIKFTHEGHVILRLQLEPVSQSQQYLIIEVEDSGIGIAPEKQKKLFTAFQQADASTTREYGGTGLGLAITYGLVQQMNGHLRLHSELDKGTCFSVTLPITASTTPDEDILSDLHNALIFDPHAITQQSYQKLFQQKTVAVDICHDIEKWERKVTSSMNYDLIVIASDCDEESLELIPLQAGFARKGQANAFIVLTIPLYSSLPEENQTQLKGWPVCEKPFTINRLEKLWKDHLTTKNSEQRPPEQPATLAEKPKSIDSLDTIKMLAVDDNDTNLKLLNAILRHEKVELSAATSGAQAVKLCHKIAFDLILMDVQMPNMDGVQACRLIRDTELNRQTPVIAFTAHAFKEEREKLLRSGMDDYLAKPIDIQKFNRLVNKWVSSKSNRSIPTKNDTDTNFKGGIDWQLSLKKANNKHEIAIEMLATLIASFESVSTDIKIARQTEKDDELLDVIHKFHGATCYVGVPRLRSLANSIESQLKKGLKLNIDELIEQLIAEMTVVESVFIKYQQA